jgi:hypothetical protein
MRIWLSSHSRVHTCLYLDIFSFLFQSYFVVTGIRVAECHCRNAANAVHSVEKVYPRQVNASSVGHACCGIVNVRSL